MAGIGEGIEERILTYKSSNISEKRQGYY